MNDRASVCRSPCHCVDHHSVSYCCLWCIYNNINIVNSIIKLICCPILCLSMSCELHTLSWSRAQHQQHLTSPYYEHQYEHDPTPDKPGVALQLILMLILLIIIITRQCTAISYTYSDMNFWCACLALIIHNCNGINQFTGKCNGFGGYIILINN